MTHDEIEYLKNYAVNAVWQRGSEFDCNEKEHDDTAAHVRRLESFFTWAHSVVDAQPVVEST